MHSSRGSEVRELRALAPRLCREAIKLLSAPISQQVIESAEKEYLAMKDRRQIKAGSEEALLRDMAALGTSSEALAVRRHFEEVLPRVRV